MVRKSNKFSLHPDHEIEVVAQKGDQVVVKRMTVSEAVKIVKKKGWRYGIFQIGFHYYKTSK